MKKFLTFILVLTIISGAFASIGCKDEVFGEKYAIIYQLDGGEFAGDAVSEYEKSDNPVILPTPYKTGYLFVGWKSGNEFITEIAAGAVGDKTLTAVWHAKTYIITFDYGEGVVDEIDRDIKFDDLIENLPVPIAPSGKTFAGWKTENGTLFSDGARYRFDSNIIVRAEYEDLETYYINYDLNGGDQWQQDVISTYTISDEALSLPIPSRTGYIFVGWKCGDQEGISEIAAGDTGNKNLLAMWQAKTYFITLDNSSASELTKWEDGTYSTKIIEVLYDEIIDIPTIKSDLMSDSEKKNNDYIFEYWYYKDKNGNINPVDITKPFNKDNINITSESITLYAYVRLQWTIIL